MRRSARKAGTKATAASFTPPETTEREIVWRSGTGRVLRDGDVVKVDGIVGRFRIMHRQPWPGLLAVQELPRGERQPASPRFVDPTRVHLRRKATNAAVAG